MTHAIDVQGIYDDLSAGKAVHYDPNSRDLRDVFLKYLDGHYIVGPRDGSDEDSGSDLDSIAHDGRLTAQEADEFYRLSTTELPWLNFSITQIAVKICN